MGMFWNTKERTGCGPIDRNRAMRDGLRLLETIKGLPVTFTFDTCSSLAPYEAIPAGITLRVQGIMFEEPEAPPEAVMVHLGIDGDPGTDLGITLSELVEVTNITELVEVSKLVA